MSLPSQELDATVQAIEKDKIAIRLSPNQIIKVDRKFLTGDIKVGERLKIEILTEEQMKKRHNFLAKAVLEEILNGSKK